MCVQTRFWGNVSVRKPFENKTPQTRSFFFRTTTQVRLLTVFIFLNQHNRESLARFEPDYLKLFPSCYFYKRDKIVKSCELQVAKIRKFSRTWENFSHISEEKCLETFFILHFRNFLHFHYLRKIREQRTYESTWSESNSLRTSDPLLQNDVHFKFGIDSFFFF